VIPPREVVLYARLGITDPGQLLLRDPGGLQLANAKSRMKYNCYCEQGRLPKLAVILIQLLPAVVNRCPDICSVVC
jgi:hypothetical protein